MKTLPSILLGALLLGISQLPAVSAELSDGLYDKQGADGLHSTVEISSTAGGARKSVYNVNAVLDLQICKLTLHAVAETVIPSGYNQSDYLAGKTTACSATENTCGSPPTCNDPLPVKFIQTTDTRLCLHWKGSTEVDCFKKIRPERLKNTVTIGGIPVVRGKQ